MHVACVCVCAFVLLHVVDRSVCCVVCCSMSHREGARGLSTDTTCSSKFDTGPEMAPTKKCCCPICIRCVIRRVSHRRIVCRQTLCRPVGDFSVPRSVGIVYRSLDWGLSQGKVLTCVFLPHIITYDI